MSAGEIKAAPAVAAGGPVSGPPAPRQAGAQRLLILGIQISIVGVVLALWEWMSRAEIADPLLVGRPSLIFPEVLRYLGSDEGVESLRATAVAVVIAFVLGTASGILAGLILGLTTRVDRVLGPFLTPLNSIPRIALAPLFIAWFGLTTTAKVVLAVSIVFFILAENARSAVRSVDVEFMRLGRVVGLGRTALLFKVVLPSAVPTIFAGLRLAFIYSVLGVVASEMIAAPSGVGHDIVLFSTSYQINAMFAVLVILVVVSIAVNWVFEISERFLLRWQPKNP